MYSDLAMSLHTFPGTVRVGGGAEGSAALSSRARVQKRREWLEPSLLYSTAHAAAAKSRLPRYRALRGMTQ